MKRIWHDIVDHRWPAALFLLYWLVVFCLDVSGWNKPANRPVDMVQPVISLHFLLPFFAGALVAWWRRFGPGRIAGGMMAGGAVLAFDAAGLLMNQFIAFSSQDSGGSGESIFELPVFLIAVGLMGSILGLVGAGVSIGLMHLVARPQGPPRQERVGVEIEPSNRAAVPHRIALLAGVLMLAVAATVGLAVIPSVGADQVAGVASRRVVTAFTVNAMLNAFLGITLFALRGRRAAGAVKVIAVLAGFITLLLGFALLDAASALKVHGPGVRAAMAGCIAGAAGDLGAAVLALIAAIGYDRKRCDALPGL